MNFVAGVTGQTGSAVARTLLDHGARVRVLIRDEGRSAEWTARGAEVVVADLDDARSVTHALEGVIAAYFLNPPAYTMEDPLGHARTLTSSVRHAIDEAAVPRVVALSSIGAHLPAGTGFIRAAHQFEEGLRGAAPSVTFVRAAFFMENWAWTAQSAVTDGVLPSFVAPVDRAFSTVSTEDIGHVAAEAMLDDATGHRIIELEGPELASPADAAAAFARHLERGVRAVEVPPTEWRAALSNGYFSERAVELFIEMYEALNAGRVVWEGDPAQHVRGVVTLDEAVGRMVAAAMVDQV